MKQPLHKLFLLVVVISIVFFSSCKKKEEVGVDVRGPVVTLEDLNADKVADIMYAYEKGDKIPLRVTASMPGKFQSGSISTIITEDGSTSTTPLTGISVGNEDIDTEISVNITADINQEFIIKVTLTDQNGKEGIAEVKYEASFSGHGGAGMVPHLYSAHTLTLNVTSSPYFSTRAPGDVLSTSAAAKADFFFGYTEASGSAKKANGTAGTLSIISASESTMANGWANLTNGRVTKLALSKVGLVFESNGSAHNISAISLAEDNTANTGTSSIAIEVGKTYTFITTDSRKGYLIIESIVGPEIKLRFVVQE